MNKVHGIVWLAIFCHSFLPCMFEQLFTLQLHPNLYQLEFVDKDKLISSSLMDGTIKLTNFQNYPTITEHEIFSDNDGKSKPQKRIHFTVHDNTIAIANDNRIILFDLAKMQKIYDWKSPYQCIFKVIYAQNKLVLQNSRNLRFIDKDTKKEYATYDFPGSRMLMDLEQKDNNIIATYTLGPHTVTLWDIQTGQAIRQLPCQIIKFLHYSDNLKYFAAISTAWSLNLYDSESGMQVAQWAEATNNSYPDDGVFCGSNFMYIKSLPLPNRSCEKFLILSSNKGQQLTSIHLPDSLRAIDYEPKNKKLAVGLDDGTVNIFDFSFPTLKKLCIAAYLKRRNNLKSDHDISQLNIPSELKNEICQARDQLTWFGQE